MKLFTLTDGIYPIAVEVSLLELATVITWDEEKFDLVSRMQLREVFDFDGLICVRVK